MPPSEDALPWLFAVARNVVRNSSRSTRRSLRLVARASAEPTYPVPGPELQIVRNEDDRMLAEALDKLNDQDREVLRLRAQEGLTVPQISTVLGCSEEAAKKRVARALQRLRRAASIPSSPGGGSVRRNEGGGG